MIFYKVESIFFNIVDNWKPESQDKKGKGTGFVTHFVTVEYSFTSYLLALAKENAYGVGIAEGPLCAL